MGTRTVITVKDEYNTFSVYQHWDGYPSGVAHTLVNTIPYAWTLPRFEAMDFAAAIIAGNKTEGGAFYITTSPDDHGDLEYTYEISQAPNGQLIIRATKLGYNTDSEEIFYGRVKDFVAKHGYEEDKAKWDKIVPSPNKIGEVA